MQVCLISFLIKWVKYRVTPKEWDCKTTQNFKNMTIWSLLFGFCLNALLWWFTKWLRAEINSFCLSGTMSAKKQDQINSVQSSLKSHPFWVSLYVLIFYLIFRSNVNSGFRLESLQILSYESGLWKYCRTCQIIYKLSHHSCKQGNQPQPQT